MTPMTMDAFGAELTASLESAGKRVGAFAKENPRVAELVGSAAAGLLVGEVAELFGIGGIAKIGLEAAAGYFAFGEIQAYEKGREGPLASLVGGGVGHMAANHVKDALADGPIGKAADLVAGAFKKKADRGEER